MRYLMLAALLLNTGWAVEVMAQSETRQSDELRPSASDGGQVELLPERPVDEGSDPANTKATAETVNGLALVITIDGAAVTLDSAVLARVPRNLARADRKLDGDIVRARGYANGQLVATTVAPDNVINASEGDGLVRMERRQIVLVLAADRPIDRVEIEAAATNAKASLDVGAAYTKICEADPASQWCARSK